MSETITELIQEYIVDFASNNNFFFVKGVQGDGYGTRYARISLSNNGQPYTINPDAVRVVIRGTKPDTNQIFNICEIIDESTIQFELTTQMLAVAGKGNYEICIMSTTENRVLTSFPFYVITSPSAFDVDFVTSSNEFTLLVEKINQVDSSINNVEVIIEKGNEATEEWNELIDEVNDAIQKVGDLDTLKTETENAKDSANLAAEQANQVKDDAIIATENAISATKSANQAVEDIQNAIGIDDTQSSSTTAYSSKHTDELISEVSNNMVGKFSVGNGAEIFNDYENNMASGDYSSAKGIGTKASSEAQHVQGKYNIEDAQSKYAHIVGNGSSDEERSNAHTLDWEGNAEFAGDVTANGCNSENPISLIGLNNTINNIDHYEFQGITDADVTYGNGFTLLIKPSDAIGNSLEQCVSWGTSDSICYYTKVMKKNESIVFSKAFVLSESEATKNQCMLIANSEGKIIYCQTSYITNYTFNEGDVLHIVFNPSTCISGEYFYMKKPSSFEPYVLNVNNASNYLTDSTFGDKALDAIMTGKQVFIRVQNSDGRNYTAIYSPVLMYQLPNYMNEYLYLFYLNDGLDSTTGLPSFNQLKLLLSKTYNASPLIE